MVIKIIHSRNNPSNELIYSNKVAENIMLLILLKTQMVDYYLKDDNNRGFY